MSTTTIQDILPLVEQPSQYLGSEINTVQKDLSRIKLAFALVFPDRYEIGTSHFGIQILYNILNEHPKIAAERVFAPAPDMETHLRSSKTSITSLESKTPLGQFDILGFSLLYELNYTNVLGVLALANIPFFSRHRKTSHPLIIAGGPCTSNPEPVADFFDAMVVGDGEKVVMEMSQTWLQWQSEGAENKEGLLKKWSKIEGVYVPEFFTPKFDRHGFQTLVPKFEDYRVVKRAVVDDLDTAHFPRSPIVPFGKPVHDRLRLEVSRGCTRGCRFCQAGMIYRPVRERSPETLLSLSDFSVASTGYGDISLLSLSTGDYSCIIPLMERLTSRYASQRIAVSFPSLRADSLTPKLMNLVKKVRKTGFTLAPEAGSQRLRDVINKNITEKDIIQTVKDAFHMGWQVVKLYFMIGLPTETEDDVMAIVDLVKKLKKKCMPNRRKAKINVSVATFIPKPHTPFQWASQISLVESKQKIDMLRKQLRMPGVQFKWQNPEVSMIEGVWARGDRRLSSSLVAAYKKGCKFDGWSDHFKYRLWEEAFVDEGIDVNFFTNRARGCAEPLPWDHIDTRVSKDFLNSEWDNATKGKHTADCRNGGCNLCGVCDFEVVQPKVFPDHCVAVPNNCPADPDGDGCFTKFRVSFSKLDQAKHFGHLELVKIMTRAIRRARIPVKFSQGFHPKPVLSFEDSLPIGLGSLNEKFYLSAREDIQPQTIKDELNRHVPKGLRITDCQLAPPKASRYNFFPATYLVTKKNGTFNEENLASFEKISEHIITRTNRKGKTRELDLKEMILEITRLSPDKLEMTLKSEPGKTMRPFEVLEHIFDLSKEEVRTADIVKI